MYIMLMLYIFFQSTQCWWHYSLCRSTHSLARSYFITSKQR